MFCLAQWSIQGYLYMHLELVMPNQGVVMFLVDFTFITVRRWCQEPSRTQPIMRWQHFKGGPSVEARE